MPGDLSIRVSKMGNSQAVIDWSEGGAIVFGRQRDPDEERYTVMTHTNDVVRRLAFARFSDARYSREQVRIEKLDEGKVSIQNIANSAIKVSVDPDRTLEHQQSAEHLLPTSFSIGEYTFRVERALHSLGRQTQFITDFNQIEPKSSGILKPKSTSNRVGDLIDLLSTATSVIQQATSKEQLYLHAVEAVRRLIDVDGAVVARCNDWVIESGVHTIHPSISALQEVQHSREVRWSTLDTERSASESMTGLDCYMAAPIVIPGKGKDEVVSILYAHRIRTVQSANREPFTALQAKIFELIACSIAAGLVRVQQQNTVNRFLQFFTPNLAEQLMKSDLLLQPSEREITVLFGDVRGFSGISERLSPRQTSEWVQDVLSELSDCVLHHSGVLVDYVGDELMAMWGAPQDQPDHATLACRCAVEMNALMPSVSERWRDKIGAETEVGIGINTGRAIVGNTGSKHKFKYGPLGDMVNRASRIQGLTKYLKVNAIIAGQTKIQLPPDGFATRRLGRARVVNIDHSIDLYELCVTGDCLPKTFTDYEHSLKDFETGDWKAAARRLTQALDFGNPDHPTLLLMNELIDRVIADEHVEGFEWDFKNK